jgi:hypothetical protein
MVMAMLRKKYKSQEVELRKWKKDTPRHYKALNCFHPMWLGSGEEDF